MFGLNSKKVKVQPQSVYSKCAPETNKTEAELENKSNTKSIN